MNQKLGPHARALNLLQFQSVVFLAINLVEGAMIQVYESHLLSNEVIEIYDFIAHQFGVYTSHMSVKAN